MSNSSLHMLYVSVPPYTFELIGCLRLFRLILPSISFCYILIPEWYVYILLIKENFFIFFSFCWIIKWCYAVVNVYIGYVNRIIGLTIHYLYWFAVDRIIFFIHSHWNSSNLVWGLQLAFDVFNLLNCLYFGFAIFSMFQISLWCCPLGKGYLWVFL